MTEEGEAEQAKRLIEDPAFNAVMARLDAEYLQNMRAETDRDKRDMWWNRLNLLDDLRMKLRGTAGAASVTAFNTPRPANDLGVRKNKR